MRIIGVDCATVDTKVGVALGALREDHVEIQGATLCSRERSAATVVTSWLKDGGGEPALLAMDAPLGWPKPLAKELSKHTAGGALETSAHKMFRRATDRFIREQLGKTPLDVGSDRIARTAYAALNLLDALRAELRLPIPLAWDPANVSTVAAIEVYPAATLAAYRISSSNYKKPPQHGKRQEILHALCSGFKLTIHDSVLDVSKFADVLDAAICTLAGRDFIRGIAMSPGDRELAEREGWIWAAGRGAYQS